MFYAQEAQLLVLLRSVLLGVAFGVYYDLLRAPRRFFRAGHGVTALLDGVFWVGVLAALFQFSVSFAAGMSRYYVLAGVGMGAAAYFCLMSGVVLGMLLAVFAGLRWVYKTVRGVVEKVQAAIARLELDKKFNKIAKKIAKTSSIFRAKGIK